MSARSNSNKEEQKEEADAKVGHDIDYYRPVIITQKCYGLLQYSDTPDKGESFKCQGIKRMLNAFVINGPGNTPVTADHALHVFEHDVDARHYQSRSSSSTISNNNSNNNSSSSDGFGGGRSKTLQERINGSKKVGNIFQPPENWKLVKDQKFDELQLQLEMYQSNKTRSGTREFHAKFYGVTDVEGLAMTKVNKDHTMPTDADTDDDTDTNSNSDSNFDTDPLNTNMGHKAMKMYKLVPISTCGVAKRTLSNTEVVDGDNGGDNGDDITTSGSGSRLESRLLSTTSRLGFIEITMQSFEEERVLHVDDRDKHMTELNDPQEKNDKKSSSDGLGLLPLSSRTSPSSNSSIIPTMNELSEFNDKFDAASNKIIMHMRNNANFLYKELTKDDFFDRTMNAGDRIVASGEKNLERMKKLMMNCYKWLQDSDW